MLLTEADAKIKEKEDEITQLKQEKPMDTNSIKEAAYCESLEEENSKLKQTINELMLEIESCKEKIKILMNEKSNQYVIHLINI